MPQTHTTAVNKAESVHVCTSIFQQVLSKVLYVMCHIYMLVWTSPPLTLYDTQHEVPIDVLKTADPFPTRAHYLTATTTWPYSLQFFYIKKVISLSFSFPGVNFT